MSLRHSIFGRLAEYADMCDADHLAVDLVISQVRERRAGDVTAVFVSMMERFEVDNRVARVDLSGQ